jgi:hypothetical protein
MVFSFKTKADAPAFMREQNYKPAFIDDMVHGSTLKLGPTPGQFMQMMRKLEPHLEFTVHIAGQLIPVKGQAHVSGKARTADPLQCSISDQFSFGWQEGQLRGRRTQAGSLSFTTDNKPTLKSFVTASWNGDGGIEVGKTYNMGSMKDLDSGITVIYAFAAVP